MSLTDDVKGFVFSHRVHGTVTADASPETGTGYDLVIRCSCRAFRVYVTPEMAADDFLSQAQRN